MPHLVALLRGLPDAIASLAWSRGRVLQLQENRLRALLHHAKRHSPWHAERLGAIDVESFRAADLPSLPPMTKADLMENWDAIVTDPHISLARAKAHMSRVAELGKVLLGAIGERIPLKVAALAGGCDATYFSQAVSECFASNMLPIDTVSPLQPHDAIIDQLTGLQPTVLIGFPSMIEILASAADMGRLQIAPKWIGTSGEPLSPESRMLVERVFGVPVSESWGSTETGPLSFGVLGQPMRLDESVAKVEPVDEKYRTCQFGERSANTLVTNIINQVLPLIRYELGDEIVLEQPAPEDAVGGPVLSDVRGRRYEPFVYGSSVVIHPAILEHVLDNDPAIVDYQVQQTGSGVHVCCRTSQGHEDHEHASQLRTQIARVLATAGLPGAEVRLEAVDKINRSPSGKVRRFVRLGDGDGPVRSPR